MKDLTSSRLSSAVLFALRIVIGWHFLYEGVAKLVIPDWTCADYLSASRWVFADWFHWIVAHPNVLRIVDLLNAWGLTLIGLALVVGCLTRTASVFGMLLLVFYYAANPSLTGLDFGAPAEGHYVLVNKNVVEFFSLFLLALSPTRRLWGIDRLFSTLCAARKKGHAATPGQPPDFSAVRRELLRSLVSFPILGIFYRLARGKYEWSKVNAITGATLQLHSSGLQDLKGELPKGRIGSLQFSRMMMGNNLIGGWSHARDLIYASSLFLAYNTEMKVFTTLELAERAGIDTMFLVNGQYPLFQKYLNVMGGAMQTIYQVFPSEEDPTTDIDQAIDNGATTLYVQGGVCDRFVRDGKAELLGKAIEHIKKQGYLAGIGAHSIKVPMKCEELGLNPDYYVKTFHHDNYWSAIPRENRVEFSVDQMSSPNHDEFHDNMFDLFPDKTIAFMQTVTKPWIAFKVLAGGAIHPSDGFKYAFENGADFICVGMFDFQIVEDVNVASDVLANLTSRTRQWRS